MKWPRPLTKLIRRKIKSVMSAGTNWLTDCTSPNLQLLYLWPWLWLWAECNHQSGLHSQFIHFPHLTSDQSTVLHGGVRMWWILISISPCTYPQLYLQAAIKHFKFQSTQIFPHPYTSISPSQPQSSHFSPARQFKHFKIPPTKSCLAPPAAPSGPGRGTVAACERWSEQQWGI